MNIVLLDIEHRQKIKSPLNLAKEMLLSQGCIWEWHCLDDNHNKGLEAKKDQRQPGTLQPENKGVEWLAEKIESHKREEMNGIS